ncbi:GNAT family N-acetyltransferase [Craterilacuibacter sinensis]|uniref:GNAT family N-acetyltransferase n=1 Tax=Craterilacuibacter sinensis TaxID=2686017 RepID=A0A845BQS6_9NEIS|nr:GNAT family N-acetyltransferase [Craterilacuibacter sinensis]MXR37594.1 GNAT family N-acetyltransferase [Craterilacuibacter sinensis]
MSTQRLLRVTADDGSLARPDLLASALAVHRQLRPMLPHETTAYSAKMERVFAGGARMTVAVDTAGRVTGLALYRIYENTYEDLRLYLDDLVTDEACRSQGIGKQLLHWCEAEARHAGCQFFALDSGTWRPQAHKLYFREDFTITSFHFVKSVQS